ncbi:MULTISPECIES: MerR family transcriptional regulator [Myroides]|uniref:MerR family transcriptional regulator n=1 Tax=Myroides albus TaxID=2562892 RepID=A0A6I3LT06_9FLAO|nr:MULTISPECIES: MerR family transcriptional regulator [Myroides]MTG99085.1 MerR family transcriptional regulator [Myroides albus]MVX36246.1 MerR family transcriptional regulator [Myroides sp. LoEW2-1]UVD80704.1 MerR family transcriptional regulator [Myroides albus]
MKLNLPDKRYYSIGELANAFDLNASTLRFWEKEFDIINPKKNAKGNRMFTHKDIENLELIYHLLKERGFTIEGAKEYLKKQPKSEMNNFELIKKLENIKNTLINIKNEL